MKDTIKWLKLILIGLGIVSFFGGCGLFFHGCAIGCREPILPPEGSIQEVTLTEGHKKAGTEKVVGLVLITLGIVAIWKLVSQTDKESEKKKCTCPTTCDCQNPPPDNWDGKSGVYHCSMYCPIHNDDPDPDPECPIHGHES